MTSDALRYGFTAFMINYHKSVMTPLPFGNRDGAT